MTANGEAETVGTILRNARLWEGLSQKELADEAGITQQAVSQYERGQRMPVIDSLVRIGSVLGNQVIVDVIRQVQREVGRGG